MSAFSLTNMLETSPLTTKQNSRPTFNKVDAPNPAVRKAMWQVANGQPVDDNLRNQVRLYFEKVMATM